jgi:hypothetical protein
MPTTPAPFHVDNLSCQRLGRSTDNSFVHVFDGDPE